MMTMEQFEEEKARLMELYGGTARDASGKRGQALARLYTQSGWTQQALAEMEHLSQTRINQLLVFGKFLIITPGNKTTHCYEKLFRALWQSTDKTATKAARFAAVEELLQEETPDKRSMKGLGKQLVAQFSNLIPGMNAEAFHATPNQAGACTQPGYSGSSKHLPCQGSRGASDEGALAPEASVAQYDKVEQSTKTEQDGKKTEQTCWPDGQRAIPPGPKGPGFPHESGDSL